MSLAFEEQLSVGKKLSDAEYNTYVEAFYKEHNAQPTTLKATRKLSPNRKVLKLDAGRMF